MIRIIRGNTYTDKFRKYKIYIDDVYCGDIKNKETKEFPAQAGNHTVFAKVDWCRSNRLNISIGSSPTELEVDSSLCGWKLFLAIIYVTFLKNQYLWIKETGSSD